ncbi:MAG TPA: hypothetical protein VII57_01285 [Dehalococcoidia bacterium]
MADGIIFEKLGVQAATIVTDAFSKSGDAMARRQGFASYRYAMVPHPVSSLTPEECKTRAREILPEVMSILGLEDAAQAPAEPADAAPAAPTNGSRPVSVEGLSDAELRDLERVVEHYYEQGWTDGLPVVPATAERVRDFADYVGRDPKEVVATLAHLDRTCTVELAAVAAIMAGCRKEHFPVVLAALEAFNAPRGWDTGLVQSTTGQCQMVIVNGPIRERLGFNSTGNLFGPGFRANATVGRALRLVILNAFGVRPHEFDQSTHGTPAKYTFCIAENEEESPWEPLHVERGFAKDASVVTAHFARSNLHVENRRSNKPEQVLLTIADSMSYAGSFEAGRGYTVVMGPEHAQLLARQGWTKQAAKQFIWEHWGRTRGELRRFGLLRDDGDEEQFLRFGQSPDSLLLVVAGAKNAGLSTVIPTVSPDFFSQAIAEPRGA